MADDAKRTENVCTRITERMLLDLSRVAAIDDRSVSEFIFLALRKELYGSIVRLPSQGVDQQSGTK